MEKIQKMGHSEAEYTQVFRLLNQSELALLEKMESLHRLHETELNMIHALINKIMGMLMRKFPKPQFSQLLSA
ncbi:MAG: hypothetical protein HQL67_07040 [Magnetococcales bacterium]|nr:hypothetical protein [Magnetococcales bacterium]